MAPSGESGIRGQVQVGPQCPVEQAGSPCPPAPLSTSVIVRAGTGEVDSKGGTAAGGEEVARGRSDADGRFEIAVDPGAYVVSAEVDAPMTCSPAAAPVRAGQYAEVVVSCDSGIR